MVTFLPDETAYASGAAVRPCEACRRLIEMLQRVVDFGADPLPTRENLYTGRL